LIHEAISVRRLAAGALALGVVLVLASCDDVRSNFTDGTAQASRDRLEQVLTALNERDADSLRAMFAESALTENGAEIEAGLDYLLPLSRWWRHR
jgi:hypothetical protein